VPKKKTASLCLENSAQLVLSTSSFHPPFSPHPSHHQPHSDKTYHKMCNIKEIKYFSCGHEEVVIKKCPHFWIFNALRPGMCPPDCPYNWGRRGSLSWKCESCKSPSSTPSAKKRSWLPKIICLNKRKIGSLRRKLSGHSLRSQRSSL
jgi:hypothetical protein